MQLTRERERELAASLANDLLVAAVVCIDATEAWDHFLTVDALPELAALSIHERHVTCERIATLARTAVVTVRIPEEN